jgi:hypothetical protein
VDASQNVGIGTASPTTMLQLTGSAAAGKDPTLTLNNTTASTGRNYQIISGDGGPLRIYDATAGVERLRINAGAPILCLAGGSTTATGTGIAFPATQSASSDANTLDDYEEGSWTPTDASGAGLTFSTATGSYEKIGRTVIARARVIYPSTANTNQATMGSLPFQPNAENTGNAGFIGYTGLSPLPSLYINSGNSSVAVYSAGGAVVTNASYSAKEIQFTCVYRVA